MAWETLQTILWAIRPMKQPKPAVRKKYKLDQPFILQYFYYLNDLSPIGGVDPQEETDYLPIISHKLTLKWPNLGRSLQTRQPVAELLGNRIVGTAILAFSALAFAASLGILLGVLSAISHQSWVDKLILSTSVLGISAPSFFIGVLIAWIFAVKFRYLTGLNVTGYMWEPQIFEKGHTLVLKNLFLPALALGIRPLAVFTQLTRSSMLDVLSSDYIRTARAKGLSERRVLIRHALRNALNPVLTSISGWLASLLAGAFFIEYIFNWKGIGKLMIDALNTNDFPVILGCSLCIGIIFVGINMLTDWLYGVLDPRVKLGS